VSVDYVEMVTGYRLDLHFSDQFSPNIDWITRLKRTNFSSHEFYLTGKEPWPVPSKRCIVTVFDAQPWVRLGRSAGRKCHPV